MIKIKNKDLLKLKRAVKRYNDKVIQINKTIRKNNLGMETLERLNYQKIKEDVKDSFGLKRILADLNSFSNQKVNFINLPSGQKITQNEYNLINRRRKSILYDINKELTELARPNKEGFSRLQMGSEREKELKNELIRLKGLEYKKGYYFNKLASSILYKGSFKYKMDKAETFRQNILDEMETLVKEDEVYEEFYEYLKDIENPLEFYEIIKQNDMMFDFFLWYKNPSSYGNFNSNEDVANYLMEAYGMKAKEKLLIEPTGNLSEESSRRSKNLLRKLKRRK